MSVEKRPRTKEDFDSWFTAAGDPWDYHGQFVQKRLRRSLSFLKEHLKEGFTGHILEIGAFDGTFTVMLTKAIPQARITVNDISAVALERAKESVRKCGEKIQFLLKDALMLQKSDFASLHGQPPNVILLLECFYYLKERDRRAMLSNLVTLFHDADLYISGPIIGPPYFREQELTKLFSELDFSLVDFDVLNLRCLHRLDVVFRPILNVASVLRSYMANQVIYLFRKNTAGRKKQKGEA